MITLNQVTLHRGTKTILDQANITINPGEHVGVVGRNGTGKSINRRLPKAGTETSGCRASGGWELQ